MARRGLSNKPAPMSSNGTWSRSRKHQSISTIVALETDAIFLANMLLPEADGPPIKIMDRPGVSNSNKSIVPIYSQRVRNYIC